jgi:hypothetical protein
MRNPAAKLSLISCRLLPAVYSFPAYLILYREITINRDTGPEFYVDFFNSTYNSIEKI